MLLFFKFFYIYFIVKLLKLKVNKINIFLIKYKTKALIKLKMLTNLYNLKIYISFII
jgi:hypothetical protein